MAGGLHLAGDGGFPHLVHHSTPHLIQRNEKLRANSIYTIKLATVDHTQRAATKGGGAITAPSASFKTATRTASTQKKSIELKRRKVQSHQCDEIGLKSTRRLHPRSTDTSNYLNPKPRFLAVEFTV
jgi:hypothetical protein